MVYHSLLVYCLRDCDVALIGQCLQKERDAGRLSVTFTRHSTWFLDGPRMIIPRRSDRSAVSDRIKFTSVGCMPAFPVWHLSFIVSKISLTTRYLQSVRFGKGTSLQFSILWSGVIRASQSGQGRVLEHTLQLEILDSTFCRWNQLSLQANFSMEALYKLYAKSMTSGARFPIAKSIKWENNRRKVLWLYVSTRKFGTWASAKGSVTQRLLPLILISPAYPLWTITGIINRKQIGAITCTTRVSYLPNGFHDVSRSKDSIAIEGGHLIGIRGLLGDCGVNLRQP